MVETMPLADIKLACTLIWTKVVMVLRAEIVFAVAMAGSHDARRSSSEE